MDQCVNVGEDSGSGTECNRFEDGGVTKTDCGKPFSASSIYIESEMTTFGGRTKCVDCQFFNDHNCQGDNVADYNDNLCLNDGLGSFRCVSLAIPDVHSYQLIDLRGKGPERTERWLCGINRQRTTIYDLASVSANCTRNASLEILMELHIYTIPR